MNDIHSRFQVDALTFGRIDQSMLETGGLTWSISTGAAIPIGRRVEVSADAFYTPLTVQRSAFVPPTREGLFNVRVIASYRIR